MSIEDLRLPRAPVITGTPKQGKTITKTQGTAVQGQSFQELLNKAAVRSYAQPKALTLSKHAMQRVEQRGVEISAKDMERMEIAVGKARDKGVTDTLVFMNNTAFIVNIPSGVVVTVVDGSEASGKENIFTNINGAVIL